MYDRNKFNCFSTACNLRCLSRIKAILPKNSQKFYCCILGISNITTLFYYILIFLGELRKIEQVKGRSLLDNGKEERIVRIVGKEGRKNN